MTMWKNIENSLEYSAYVIVHSVGQKVEVDIVRIF